VPASEGTAAVPLRELCQIARAMRPDCLLLGETAGAIPAGVLVDAAAGRFGILAAGTASNPEEALECLAATPRSDQDDVADGLARVSLARVFHLVIHQERLSDGSRRITRLSEVFESVDGAHGLRDLFLFEPTGTDENGRIQGSFRSTPALAEFVTHRKRSAV